MNNILKKTIKSKGGIDLYYEITPENASGTKGLTLFFIHGVGGDLDAWQFVRAKLHQKEFSTIAMDIRGHGISGHPRDSKSYTLTYFMDDMIAVLDAEKINKVILIGHSLGAVLVTHFAIHHQERIEKLVLISSSYIPPHYFTIPGIFPLINTLAFLSPPPLNKRHSYYPPGKHHEDVETYGLIRTIMRHSLKSYLLSSKEILKTNIESSLHLIKVPTLIISGTKDTVFPTKISEHIHSLIPHSQLKLIEGANHVVVLNNVNEVVNDISDFIST
jgi:pimeloyl-ACP methyl ester carboxylesterase